MPDLRRTVSRLGIVWVLLIAGALACRGDGGPELIPIERTPQRLVDAFNADPDMVRAVLLVSPT